MLLVYVPCSAPRSLAHLAPTKVRHWHVCLATPGGQGRCVHARSVRHLPLSHHPDRPALTDRAWQEEQGALSHALV